MSSLTILGIDPGTATTGFGVVVSNGSRLQGVACGCIHTKPEAPAEERLQKIFKDTKALIKKYSPDIIAVEQLFFGMNVKTALAVGQARGVILLAAADSGVALVEYTPLQVKQALVRYGRADKKQVQYMVKTILGLKEVPKPDDAADALALAICHAHCEGLIKAVTSEQ